jgi:cell division protein FtsB
MTPSPDIRGNIEGDYSMHWSILVIIITGMILGTVSIVTLLDTIRKIKESRSAKEIQRLKEEIKSEIEKNLAIHDSRSGELPDEYQESFAKKLELIENQVKLQEDNIQQLEEENQFLKRLIEKR